MMEIFKEVLNNQNKKSLIYKNKLTHFNLLKNIIIKK
jgi:hypothetical protein